MVVEKTACDHCQKEAHGASYYDDHGWIAIEGGEVGAGVSTLLTAGRKKDGTAKTKFRAAGKALHFCSFLCLRLYIEGGK